MKKRKGRTASLITRSILNATVRIVKAKGKQTNSPSYAPGFLVFVGHVMSQA